MSHPTIYGLIGLFFFLTGLLALYAASPSPTETVPPTSSQAPPSAGPEQPVPIPGVGPAVQEVLFGSGRAGVLETDALSQIPPQVTRALIEHGAVLTIGGQP